MQSKDCCGSPVIVSNSDTPDNCMGHVKVLFSHVRLGSEDPFMWAKKLELAFFDFQPPVTKLFCKYEKVLSQR